MILRAPFVLASSGTVLRDGFVHIEGERVVTVGEGGPAFRRARSVSSASSRVHSFDDSVILPGLVNAHVHLELTALQGLLPREQGFSSWLRGMIPARRDLESSGLVSGTTDGINLSLSAGTTTVGDISSTGVSQALLSSSRLSGIVFEEAIGLDPDRAKEVARSVVERARRGNDSPGVLSGISPHAPYSVSSPLLARLLRMAGRLRFPLTMHLSESPEEIQMIQDGTGPLANLLREMGILAGGYSGEEGMSPIQHVARHGLLSSGALLVHMNYLTPGDLELLSADRAGFHIVCCPGSHRFFGHEPYPLDQYRAAGISVCLGTDGLSSNDSLSMFEEMKEAARMFPGLPPKEMVRMATTAGARALGFSDRGALHQGALADVIVIRTPDFPTGSDQVLEGVVQGPIDIERTMTRGTWVVSERPSDGAANRA